MRWHRVVPIGAYFQIGVHAVGHIAQQQAGTLGALARVVGVDRAVDVGPAHRLGHVAGGHLATDFVASGTINQANVAFKHVGNNLEVLLTGTADKLVLQNWYLGELVGGVGRL